MAIERRHLHEVDVQIVLDLWQIRFNSSGAVLFETHTCVSNKLDGLKYRPCHHRFEHIQLEVAL